ncbi:MAG: GTPase Era [Spirochaetota bacterium]
MKSAVVSVIGRPSSGKSTLINFLCGEKVSITASSPQTTRNAIRGILTEPRGQLILIDTPGYHLSEAALNKRLLEVAESSLAESDIILYIIDASRAPGEEELSLLTLLQNSGVPSVVAANKFDLPDISSAAVNTFLEQHAPHVTTVEISAKTGQNVDSLLAKLFELAPEGEQLYPDEFYTDQDPEFRASEIIREKVVQRVTQELPHAVYVEIADMEIDPSGSKLWIRAVIMVEKTSQVGMVVGKQGSGIREIRKAAQKELKRLFPYEVYLDLRVKTQPKWRRNDILLKKIIH